MEKARKYLAEDKRTTRALAEDYKISQPEIVKFLNNETYSIPIFCAFFEKHPELIIQWVEENESSE